MVELTVPWETRCEEAYERKMAKYTELQEQCRSRGWNTWLFPAEIGYRGFPAQSLCRMLGKLGIKTGEGCMETRTSSRECVQLAVDEERGEEVVASHWSVVSDQHYGSAFLRVSWA